MSIENWWAALRDDLRKHWIAGVLTGFVGSLAVGVAVLVGAPSSLEAMWLRAGGAVLGGFAVGSAVGWAKEYVWDRWRQHMGAVVDRKDFLVTGRGATVGAIVGSTLLALFTR